jgi:hypothetical protein
MHQHVIPVLREELSQEQRKAANPAPREGSFFRGLFFAILLSIPIWGLVAWLFYVLFH